MEPHARHSASVSRGAHSSRAQSAADRLHVSRAHPRRYALSFTTAFSRDGVPLPALGPSAEGALARLLAATAGQGVPGVAPADARAIATLERVEDPDSAATCAICLDDLKDGSPAARLPRCSHTFHEDCLLPWLRNCHGTCPVCRTPLSDEPPAPASDSQAAASATFAGGISPLEERSSLYRVSRHERHARGSSSESRRRGGPSSHSHTRVAPQPGWTHNADGGPPYHPITTAIATATGSRSSGGTGMPHELLVPPELLASAASVAAASGSPSDARGLARQRAAALTAHYYERQLARRSEREQVLRERSDEVYERERRIEQAADSIRAAAASSSAGITLPDAFDEAIVASGLRATWEVRNAAQARRLPVPPAEPPLPRVQSTAAPPEATSIEDSYEYSGSVGL